MSSEVTELSTGRMVLLGVQHVLAFYAGAVIVPLIVGPAIGLSPDQVGFLISLDMFTCGIATLLQVMGTSVIGIGLPVMLGCTFTAVGPMILIGKLNGITAIYGAIMASGAIVIILSQFMGTLIRFFPPVVRGSVVTTIGLSLIPVALGNAGGGVGSPNFGAPVNLFLAFFTLVVILAVNRLFRRSGIQALSVLIGIVAGTLLGVPLGVTNFSQVYASPWLRGVAPFHFGWPTFYIPAILTMTLVGIVSMIESTGVYFALGEIVNRDIQPEDVRRGLRAEGLAAIIGAVMNSFPYTTFSQNVGLVAMTKVTSRVVIVIAAIILICLGFLPKVAGFTQSIPPAVLGGAMVAMFGMVLASGIRMFRTVDFRRVENLLVVAVAVGIGMGVSVTPALFAHLPQDASMFLEDGIVMGSVAAVLMNLFFNGVASESLASVAQDASAEAI